MGSLYVKRCCCKQDTTSREAEATTQHTMLCDAELSSLSKQHVHMPACWSNQLLMRAWLGKTFSCVGADVQHLACVHSRCLYTTGTSNPCLFMCQPLLCVPACLPLHGQ